MQQIISRKEAREQGLKHYFTGKPCKYEHVAERLINGGQCCACYAEYQRKYREQNKEKLAEKDRKYRAQNKEKIAEKSRKYYEQNKDELIERRLKYVEQNKETIAEYKREYYEQNRDKIAEYRKQNRERFADRVRKYNEQNRDKIAEKKRKYVEKNKEKILERKTKYRKANPEQVFIRNSLTRILTNWKGGRADAEKLLGYTCEQLREHIESQFKDGMSWDDRSAFHIDHVKPVSAFLKEGITDPAIINALSNLQPLWAHENLSKKDKWDGE